MNGHGASDEFFDLTGSPNSPAFRFGAPALMPGRAVIELIDQADAVVRQLRDDANAFVQSLDEIGNAHAARIERALTHLRGLVETIGAERQRMAALADTHQLHGAEKSHGRAVDARENFPA